MLVRTMHIVTVSGGKDSVAAWLHVFRDLGLPCEAVFADTGHESPVTYEYLDYLEEAIGPIVSIRGNMQQLAKRLDPDEPLTMLSMCRHKQRFPGKMSRFCTTELKLKPLKAYVSRRQREEPDASFVIVNGVRAEESPRRAAMETRGHDDFMGIERWLPIHDWTADQVFDCHRRHGIEPNPLYLQGFGRVGCFPCIFARKGELGQIARRYPEAFDRLGEMERDVAAHSWRGLASFFAADKTAQAYRSKVDPKSGVRYADAEDVRRWALGEFPRGSLFEPIEEEDLDGPTCVSMYGLCE